jgi:hypothetical protein
MEEFLMDLTGLGSIFDFGKAIIERFVPDPAAKMKATLDLAELNQKGELAKLAMETGLMQGQIDINKAEAASTSLFVSGWRPAAGWVCVIGGLGYTFVGWPLLTWASGIWKFPAPPMLDMGTLLTLLGGMLGLAGARTIEKLNGVAAK